MRNKKDLAELIFDYFRRTNSRSGHIMPMRNVKFQVIEKLNPKEQKLRSCLKFFFSENLRQASVQIFAVF